MSLDGLIWAHLGSSGLGADTQKHDIMRHRDKYGCLYTKINRGSILKKGYWTVAIFTPELQVSWSRSNTAPMCGALSKITLRALQDGRGNLIPRGTYLDSGLQCERTLIAIGQAWAK